MNNIENCDNGKEYASGNIFLRPVHLDKIGDCICGHRHNFDHTTFILSGTVRVEAVSDLNCAKAEKKTEVFGTGQWFLVKADWYHKIIALERNVKFVCIYSHRSPQGEIVQEYNGWSDAHACK